MAIAVMAMLAFPAHAATQAQIIKRLTAEVRQLETHQAKHAWPDLTDKEKKALAGVLKTLPAGIKFDIVCNLASCDDLAEDIDDSIEKAGFDSLLDHTIGPLGYGIAIQVNPADHDAALKAAAAIKMATEGRLDLSVIDAPRGIVPPSYVTIFIGKYQPTK